MRVDASKRDARYEERVPFQFIESSFQNRGTRCLESFFYGIEEIPYHARASLQGMTVFV
ncbi:hypothetical protein KI743_13025 [Vibrio sp. D420a]|uniref:hypothetical protein n=1 Tax=Vibrio sp. D420a TaxID=2836895 RepID=UPI0025544C17|nr:hypothetical protein [Vibrio sp. D420a]MDK9762927.1 hypothetical protein [Vibrio sp. D420a]